MSLATARPDGCLLRQLARAGTVRRLAGTMRQAGDPRATSWRSIMWRVASALASFLTVLAYLISTAPAGEDQYRNEIERWRQKRLADLKAEDGWLSVSGLFWLKSGDTTVGSDPSNDVLLPARLPGSVGSLKLAGGKVSLRVAPGVSVSRNGKPFEGGLILSDADGQADILALEDVKLILLKRGARFALRIKDNQSPLRTSFAGLRWYPPNREWRIEAKFVPYPTRSKLVLDTIVGESEEADSPGYVTFEHGARSTGFSPRARRMVPSGLCFATAPAAGQPTVVRASCTRMLPRETLSCSISTRPPISPARISRMRHVHSRLPRIG